MVGTFIVGALVSLILGGFFLLLVERDRLKQEIKQLDSLLGDALGDLRMTKAASHGLQEEVNALNKELSYAHSNIEMLLDPKMHLAQKNLIE